MDTETPKGERIAKVLARAGVASRREAERMIEAGRIAVNGKVIDSPALNVDVRARITVDGKPMTPPEPPRLWMYHKPPGLVTTDSDEKGRKTIYQDLPEDMPRVMSVGRLDLNSEGLILLTNDGGLKRKLELPATGWLRKYRVRINGRPTEETFEPLRRGLNLQGEIFQPMMVSIDRQQGANAWLTIGIREGKNREIRRAMEAIQLNVNRLIRVSYGPFQLGNLKVSGVEELRRKVLRDQLGMTDEDLEAPGAPAKPARPVRGKTSVVRGKRPPLNKGPLRGKDAFADSDPLARAKPAGKPGGKPTGKPSGKPSGSKAFGKPMDRKGGKAGAKPGFKSGPNTGSKSGPKR
ncbi:pseudouridine synthase [Planktotalea arctica]|uniref:pseudouridine synthase n=1 Tax=Planktotalea arctica TaxID=1481893 RepID=UPI000A172534|nr:pseudouridine synthase [Planktotalea arctica]